MTTYLAIGITVPIEDPANVSELVRQTTLDAVQFAFDRLAEGSSCESWSYPAVEVEATFLWFKKEVTGPKTNPNPAS